MIDGQGKQHSDLRGHEHRSTFRLFQTGRDLAGVVIQTGAEPSEGPELLEPRIGEIEVARDAHWPIYGPLLRSASSDPIGVSFFGHGLTQLSSAFGLLKKRTDITRLRRC